MDAIKENAISNISNFSNFLPSFPREEILKLQLMKQRIFSIVFEHALDDRIVFTAFDCKNILECDRFNFYLLRL